MLNRSGNLANIICFYSIHQTDFMDSALFFGLLILNGFLLYY